MRRFILHVAGFVAIQALLFGLLAAKYGADPEEYLAAVNLKHRRLETMGDHRVIVVGGSNAAFGVNSIQLALRLDRPTVNMALHAGIGLDFMLRDMEAELRPNDLILLTLEYEHFHGDATSWDRVLFPLIEQRPSLIGILTPQQVKHLGDAGGNYFGNRAWKWFRYLKGKKKRYAAIPYRASCFNNLGDVVGHHGLPPTEGRNGAIHVSTAALDERLPETILRLNTFALRCQEAGALVVLTFAPMSRENYERNEDALHVLEERLRAELTFPVLGSVESMVLPIDCFYDTNYHLTEDGKTRRTGLMLDQLQALGEE